MAKKKNPDDVKHRPADPNVMGLRAEVLEIPETVREASMSRSAVARSFFLIMSLNTKNSSSSPSCPTP